ncbi:MAG: ROK family protein [Hyphomicrobiales bacterium]
MRIGIDLGGTKVAGMALSPSGTIVAENHRATPKGDYHATLATIAEMVGDLEARTGETGSVGICAPGSISPASGRVQNANSTWLNDRLLTQDLEQCLQRPVKIANDADCFTLSEATDGAGRQAGCVFGVIIGTGCGGGLAVAGQLVSGPHRATGEWGHVPLPWPLPDEVPGPHCWCGLNSCLETWLSGSGIERDHRQVTGRALTGEEISTAAGRGDTQAEATLARHAARLARGLAMIVNIVDPDIIVLGGGLSQMPHLYRDVPAMMAPYIFAEQPDPKVVAPKHGAASGVRGAAWLWSG